MYKMEIAVSKKVAKNFNCESCTYKCSKESDFNKHLSTRKHAITSNGNKTEVAGYKKIADEFNCANCQKKYNTNSGLWKHEKKCKKVPLITETSLEETNPLTHIVIELMKSNAELQKQMFELCSKIQPIANNSHNNNSHNKTFNLNFFLNEQCKDAMNIMDFVDTFKLDFADLDSVGKLGYVEGISNIIIQKLNEMDIYKRPIHCSDLKREITHVKDRGVWEKDNGNHDKLRLAIRHITQKNIRLLNPWIEAHPQAQASAHYLNDLYMNYIKQSMGGKGDLDDNESKIIKKIAKVILIDK